jgi:hypothetical protein
MKEFAFEISAKNTASDSLQTTGFPNSLSELGQGSDDQYMHFTAGVDLVNAKDKVVGQP